MTGRTGEVVVKRDGHVHAISAPELSGPISVDVDDEHVEVPPEVHVSFDDPADDDAPDLDPLETDGGAAPTRSEVELRGGLAMSEEQSWWALVAASVGLLVTGYLHATGDQISSIVILIAAALLGWFSINSLTRWREVEG